MNVQEIKVQAQLHMAMQMQLAYCIRFINECLNELATAYDTACIRDNISLSITEDTWTNISDDLMKLKEIKLNGVKYFDYEIEGNQIRCEDTGTFDINYLRLPNPVIAKTEVPETHSSFHYAIALFVASREKSRLFGEEDTENLRFMNEFIQKGSLINSRLRKKPRRVKV